LEYFFADCGCKTEFNNVQCNPTTLGPHNSQRMSTFIPPCSKTKKKRKRKKKNKEKENRKRKKRNLFSIEKQSKAQNSK